MSQIERIFEFDRLLRGNRPPTKRDVLERFEITEATFKRDLAYMRDRLNAPIEYVKGVGYRYSEEQQFTLPGLWFSADEVQALLLMLHLLDQMQPSLLRDEMQPFADRLRELARIAPAGSESIESRISFIPSTVRTVDPAHLQVCIQATLTRKRLWIKYNSRSREEITSREVSPSCLIYYRGNWYLDAWCHAKEAPRRFAIDAILEAKVCDAAAVDQPRQNDAPGYGIFAEPASRTAILIFNSSAARWVEKEQWHPRQEAIPREDGSLELRVPYGNSREIIMDILRYGPDVEVNAPTELRSQIVRGLTQALENYQTARRPVESAIRQPIQSVAV
jgi:predicted DNA-binding transcriptional regulator YafY